MSKRAVIYGRVSTDMQRDNYSIPSQVAECLKYVKQRGYSLVGDQYVDHETGHSVSSGNGAIRAYIDDYTSRELSRPSLDAAIDYLENVGYDVLVVHALDRLARDPYIRQTLEQEIFSRGGKVEYVLGNYEETPEGEVRKDLDATFAKWENAKRVERSTRGKRNKAQKGLFVGGRPPYGYTIAPDAFGGLEIDHDQADVVRLIFHLYLEERLSFGAIAYELGRRNIKSYTGKDKWHKTAVRNILENSTYAGTSYYNKHKMKTNTCKVRRSREEWIEFKTPQIIDPDTFQEAQILIANNRDSFRRQPTHFYLLSRIIRCIDCEMTFRSNYRKARIDHNRRAARSYRHSKKEGHCMNREISANIIEPLVWDTVRKLLLEPTILREGYEQALEHEMANRSRQLLLKEKLQKAIGKIELRLQNLTRAYTDPDIGMSKTEYISQRKHIELELKTIGEKMQEIEEALLTLPTPEEYATIERFAEEVRKRIDDESWEPTPENKRKILDLLNVQVWITKDYKFKVTGWFGESDSVSYKMRLHSARQDRRIAGMSPGFHLHRCRCLA